MTAAQSKDISRAFRKIAQTFTEANNPAYAATYLKLAKEYWEVSEKLAKSETKPL